MLTFLFIVLAVAVTFLITDFRRWLQIRDILSSHEDEMDWAVDSAFDAGYEWGATLTKYVYDPKTHLNNQE